MRVRSRTTPGVQEDIGLVQGQSSPADDHTSWGYNGSDFTTFTYSPTKTENFEDVITPNFHKTISDGGIVNNPFMHKVVEVEDIPVVDFHHRTTKYFGPKLYGFDWQGQYRPFGDGASATPNFMGYADVPGWADTKQSVIDMAVTSAHANVDESSMLALASAYETGKTIGSVTSIIKRARKILRNVEKWNVKALRNEITPKELTQRYMECRYAIRPLMYDLKGIASAAKKHREPIRRTYRGSAKQQLQAEDQIQSCRLFYESEIDIDRKAEISISARAGVLCNVDVDDLVIYGIDQLAESAWELFPFSFIADWFFNIGDTIAAWTPNAGVMQLASWVTVKQDITFTNSSGACRSTANGSLWNVDNYSTIGDFTWQHREQVTERFIDPQLSTWPRVKLRLNGLKILDLGIILTDFRK